MAAPSRKAGSRSRARTSRQVHAAAVRAVDRVLASNEMFALLIRRLEEAGWHVERPASAGIPLTPPLRAR